ncbi:MarR family winged helix-turn-helix transcriptional regulator [Luteipulveratus mongoliensis]|uniref:MarR family winged helix-turn-helix transcriptional regulator n=1 Tax=Luteipulveratus mongoliensis TaxID=571913 RepID=UPI00069862C8|nr:MarR family transcriptional regulator [Luteipulveratus mongoliensis]
MAADLDSADEIATDMVHVIKAMATLRQHPSSGLLGVERSAYPVLFTLTQDSMRVSTLAEHVGNDVSTVSRQVSGLVDADLVERLPDPDDRRAHLVGLTEQGHEVVRQARARRAEWFQRLLEDWSPDEVAALRTSLNHLRTTAQDHRRRLDEPTASPAPTTIKETP